MSRGVAAKVDPALQVRFAVNGSAVRAFEIVPAGGQPQGRNERTQ